MATFVAGRWTEVSTKPNGGMCIFVFRERSRNVVLVLWKIFVFVTGATVHRGTVS